MEMHPMMSCGFAAVRLPGRLALRSDRSNRPSPMMTTTMPAVPKKPSARFACASSRRDDAEFSCDNGEFDDGGRLVDDGMAVLRRRIQEMEAAERGQDEWAAREKEWSTYDTDVWECQLLGVLQALLIDSRPGVGVGLLVAVLVLAVPAFAFVLVKFLLDASRAIISNLDH